MPMIVINDLTTTAKPLVGTGFVEPPELNALLFVGKVLIAANDSSNETNAR